MAESKRPNAPYDVGEGGLIRFHPEEVEIFRSMFAHINIDIDMVWTEADFDIAFNKAGDYLFEKIIEEAKNGERYAIKFIAAYLRHDYSEAQAIIGRESFELIPGGRAEKGDRGTQQGNDEE